MDKWLNRIVNVAVLLMAVAVLNASLTAGKQKVPPALEKGSFVDAGPLGLQQRTVLIFVNSQCQFCTQMMPFLRDVSTGANRPNVAGKPFEVVAVAQGETVADTQQYLREHRVNVARVIPLEASGFKPQRTPTMILLRKDGMVIDSWVGAIPEDRLQNVYISILAKLGPRAR